MSQAARLPEAGEFGLAWPGEPTGLAGLAFWLQAGPGTTLAAALACKFLVVFVTLSLMVSYRFVVSFNL